MGNAFKTLDKQSEALGCFVKSYEANPNFIQARMQKLHLELQFCDWRNFYQEQNNIQKFVRQKLSHLGYCYP